MSNIVFYFLYHNTAYLHTGSVENQVRDVCESFIGDFRVIYGPLKREINIR